MKVPASQWNKMVAYALSRRVRAVMNREALEWAHAWKTAVVWNSERERFEAIIKPGFVNGLDVVTRIEIEEETYGDVPLTDFPAIPLTSTREVSASVPEFFDAFRVPETSSPTIEQISEGITEVIEGLPTDETEERRLVACDLVLQCTRPRTTVEWTVTPSETGSQATFVLGVKQAEQTARIVATKEWMPIQASDALSRLEGGIEDSGLDECLVATVFFLSPPGVGIDYPLGADWQAFVRHDLFWNAEHIVSGNVSPTPQPISLNLAGVGAAANAQLIVNQILAGQNDADAAVLQFMQANEIKGRITTPGSAKPADFDMTARLDPPFPYKGRS